MQFEFKTTCSLTLEHKLGDSSSKHVSTKFNLEVSDNLEPAKYLDAEGLPTANGSQAITQCLVQGLIGNIHMANESGFRNDAEHLRYIISELERGFVSIAEVKPSTF